MVGDSPGSPAAAVGTFSVFQQQQELVEAGLITVVSHPTVSRRHARIT